MKCPQCSREFTYKNSPARPFCSERCQAIDLGHWLQESYRVPTQDAVNEDAVNEGEENEGEEREEE